MIYKSILDLIGNTPIIEYDDIFIKLEQFNPAGSIKDRVALKMLNKLEQIKNLNKNSTVIEVTSGNTGIALAMVCAIKRYNCIIIMLDNVSKQKINYIKAYGAKVVLMPHQFGFKNAFKYAKKLAKKKNTYFLNQFNNLNNPLAHESTATEIMNDFDELDYLVCGIGTGGTISYLGKKLKEKYKNLKVIGVLPSEEKHDICGIGSNVISDVLDLKVIDRITYVSTFSVNLVYKELSKKGLLLGKSSVASFIVSKEIVEKNNNKKVLMIAPDSGLKYLDDVDFDV